MTRCDKCSVVHDGSHACYKQEFCGQCFRHWHLNEINGHRCETIKEQQQKWANEDHETLAHLEAETRHFPTGVKHDQEKPDLSLVPSEFSAMTAKAFMYGATKYGRYNYLSGMDWHRLVAAAKRHIDAFQDGEDLDPESGISHLGHAAANLAILSVYITNKLGKDTRHK